MNRASSATGWVRNPDGTLGWTWNPLTGCLNHTPEGLCLGGMFPCYAWRLANGRLRQRYLANSNVADATQRLRDANSPLWDRVTTDPFYPRFWVERLDEPITKWSEWGRGKMIKHYQSPKGIFVCDMSDLFGIGIPEDWTLKVLNTIRRSPQHRFYLLTKQPQNLPQWSPFPDNCWVGVTATDTRMALNACLKLGDIKASIRYLSIEPMLNSINLPPELLKVCGISWLIIGAQTKPYKPPKIEWVEEIVSAADRAGVKVFLKDNLKPIITYPTHQWAWAKYVDSPVYTGLLKQELPK